jgi:hypothetical protein
MRPPSPKRRWARAIAPGWRLDEVFVVKAVDVEDGETETVDFGLAGWISGDARHVVDPGSLTVAAVHMQLATEEGRANASALQQVGGSPAHQAPAVLPLPDRQHLGGQGRGSHPRQQHLLLVEIKADHAAGAAGLHPGLDAAGAAPITGSVP